MQSQDCCFILISWEGDVVIQVVFSFMLRIWDVQTGKLYTVLAIKNSTHRAQNLDGKTCSP